MMSAADHLSPEQFYHGTVAEIEPGGLISPGNPANYGGISPRTRKVWMTADLEHAKTYGIRAGMQPEHQPHVYVVEPTGDYSLDRGAREPEFTSKKPLRVIREAWRHPQTMGEMD